MREIRGIAIHHSAGPNTQTAESVAKYHLQKWKLRGYHRMIEADGTVYDGRRVQRSGANVKGLNSHIVGVCVIGDNTTPGREWTIEQQDALERQIHYFHGEFPLAVVGGHRDYPGTATLCPGLSMSVWMKERSIVVPMISSHGIEFFRG